MTTKAVITGLDNLSNLGKSLAILKQEPLDEIIIVNNGSRDGTREWLAGLSGRTKNARRKQYSIKGEPRITVLNRENLGAGPGRNAGLDAAGDFDYIMMLDGGIRPLRGGTQRMLNYLKSVPEADVIGVEIADFETDLELAWRRWPTAISPDRTYINSRLSHTAYCMTRRRAWDNLRFSEEGPFAEPGWGVDDDEMAYRWQEAKIQVDVITCNCKHGHPCSGVHPYRHASGSFRRLYEDTGIWPTQYGSVYEKRLVKLWQDWPQYQPGGQGPGAQWGEPWLTVVVEASTVSITARAIKIAHTLLRLRKFEDPYSAVSNPYSIVLWNPTNNKAIESWAQPRRYRQHHGNTVIIDEYGDNRQIVSWTRENEDEWTGDFRICSEPYWLNTIRPNSYLYGVIKDVEDVVSLIEKYNDEHPPQPTRMVTPKRKGEIV